MKCGVFRDSEIDNIASIRPRSFTDGRSIRSALKMGDSGSSGGLANELCPSALSTTGRCRLNPGMVSDLLSMLRATWITLRPDPKWTYTSLDA
jgi:hypothetical protein